MNSTKGHVCVVGAGVVGLTCALLLSEFFNVTVIAEKIGSESDSVKATAIWHVYLVQETPEVLFWAGRTLEHLYGLAEAHPESGVVIVRGIELFRVQPFIMPTWHTIPKHFELLDARSVASFNNNKEWNCSQNDVPLLSATPVRWGYEIEAPAASMDLYLPWLLARVLSAGCTVKRRYVTSLQEATEDFDLVVNCSGFGASHLAADADFIPCKGQYYVLKDKNETSRRLYIGDDDHPSGMSYAIPRCGEIMIGGTAEMGVSDLTFDLDWNEVIQRASLYAPWLRNYTEDDQARPPVVGVRPYRPAGIRVEVDLAHDCPVVHNYGHGGSGFSLSWGCAEKTLELCLNVWRGVS